MSVLVVDDNPSNIMLLQALLARQGLSRIHVETDSRLVEERLVECQPDLILLDLHMPHLDGYEVLRQIQAYAAGTFLPVMVLTADASAPTRERALQQGAQDFLTKPLDASETVLRVANLLRTRQLYASLRHSLTASDVPRQRAGDDAVDLAMLRQVIEQRAITPVFQPIVDVVSLASVGHEALSRFPPRGLSPDRWFARAFDLGLGVELEWLAATMAVTYLDTAPENTFLAINMSPATVMHIVSENLCSPELASRIVIELTEHVPVEDYTSLHRALGEMRAQGARLSADDLGSGYAGFRHLIRLQPDIIKLDISIVSGIHRSREQQALARALVTFAGDVGAQLIAEGVEEVEELSMLREIGVPWAQGYYLGRPQPRSTRVDPILERAS